jgi:ketosteroid isomerase-like protein
MSRSAKRGTRDRVNEPASIELVRQGFEQFQREGPGAFRPLLALADPEIECYAAPGIEPAGRYIGREAALRWWEDWFEAWEDFRMEPSDFIEVREGVIAVPLTPVSEGQGERHTGRDRCRLRVRDPRWTRHPVSYLPR